MTARIVKTETGVFYAQRTAELSCYYDTIEHMPVELRDKMRLLIAADTGTTINGIGIRVKDDVFWISEDDVSDESTTMLMVPEAIYLTLAAPIVHMPDTKTKIAADAAKRIEDVYHRRTCPTCKAADELERVQNITENWKKLT